MQSYFVPTRPKKAQVLFLPSREKLKFCSDPAKKNSYFVPAQPRKTQVFTYNRAFLTYGGSFRMKKIINYLIMTQSNPPYRFLRSLDCPFKGLCLKYVMQFWASWTPLSLIMLCNFLTDLPPSYPNDYDTL